MALVLLAIAVTPIWMLLRLGGIYYGRWLNERAKRETLLLLRTVEHAVKERE
jgi:hypothetical protein